MYTQQVRECQLACFDIVPLRPELNQHHNRVDTLVGLCSLDQTADSNKSTPYVLHCRVEPDYTLSIRNIKHSVCRHFSYCILGKTPDKASTNKFHSERTPSCLQRTSTKDSHTAINQRGHAQAYNRYKEQSNQKHSMYVLHCGA
jgi:hypothetical protein